MSDDRWAKSSTWWQLRSRSRPKLRQRQEIEEKTNVPTPFWRKKAQSREEWKKLEKFLPNTYSSLWIYLSNQWEYSCEGKSLIKKGKLVVPKALREKAMTLAHCRHEAHSETDHTVGIATPAAKTIALSRLPERPWQHLAVDFYDAGSDTQKLCIFVLKRGAHSPSKKFCSPTASAPSF